MLRLWAQVLAGYFVLLIVGALWHLFPLSALHPELVVLWAAYLGITARAQLSPSVVAAVSLGYLADLIYGLPSGLMAFICGLVSILCHVLQGRLLIRGTLYTAVFSFVISLLAGALILAIRLSAGLLPQGMGASLWDITQVALTTAIFGPALFSLARRVDSRFARTRRERDAALAGFWVS